MKTKELTICSTSYLHQVPQTACLWRHHTYLFREHTLPCWKQALPCRKHSYLLKEQTPLLKEHTHPCRVHVYLCRVDARPHRELPVSVLTWSECRKIHIPLHMIISEIAQDTRMSPSFPFQLQCREHTVVIGTHIFPLEPFNQHTGPRVDIPTTIKDIFFLLFTTSVVSQLQVRIWVSRWEIQYMATNNIWRVAHVHGVHNFDGHYTATHDTRLLEDNRHSSLHACHW